MGYTHTMEYYSAIKRMASPCFYVRNVSGSETVQSVTGVFTGEYGIIAKQSRLENGYIFL